jgi:NAD(P)-dependent dehydrogenase (short-subunit alcohol dehydrogenase family)
MHTTKHVFISGAFGGIGRVTTQLLVGKGWQVFAGDQNPEIIPFYKDHQQVTPLLIDIRDPKAIEKAFKEISQKSDGLDAIITMAGILKVGSVAELPLDELKEILDINLLGMYEVNRRFLPLILQRNGRIVTMSSEIGKQSAAPFNGLYSISKHAVEAYSDALRRELAFLGIKVIKIQPGPFKTSMTRNAEKQFIEAKESSHYFKDNLKKGITYLPKVYKNAHDPEDVAKVILKALEATKPKIAYAIKPDLSRLILDLLPTRWGDFIIRKALS